MPKQTLKAATKKSLHQAKVEQAGMLGTDMGEFILQEGMTVVEQAVGRFIERVHTNINNEKDMVTTGKINQIEMKAEGGSINVYAPAHLIFQDRGVNGYKQKLYDTPHSYKDKMPPVHVFKEWIKNKQIFLTEKNDKHRKYDDRLSDSEKQKDRAFKELTDEQLIERAAWGMAKKVFNEGFKPRHIYSKEIPQLVQEVEQELQGFVLQQINQVIDINPRKGGGNRIVIKPSR